MLRDVLICEAQTIVQSRSISQAAGDFDIRDNSGKLNIPIIHSLEQLYDNIMNVLEDKKSQELLKKQWLEQQRRIKEYLRKQGISERKIKNIIKKAEQGDFKDLYKIFDLEFIFNEFKEELKYIEKRDILLMTIMFIWILIFNSLLLAIFAPFGPELAVLLRAVIGAPITEELLKRAAVKHYKSITVGGSFILGELVLYVMQAAAYGTTGLVMLLYRLIAATMHVATMFLHKQGQLMSQTTNIYSQNRGLKNQIEESAYKAAVLLHAFWNAMAASNIFSVNTIVGTSAGLFGALKTGYIHFKGKTNDNK